MIDDGSPARSKRRAAAFAAVLGLLALPALVALHARTSFHLRNRNTGSLLSSGDVREYVLHVPASYDASRPAPLVISMHGAGGWPVQHMELSGWNRIADREGFLVVYPAGRNRSRVWRVNAHTFGLDVRFISDLIDDVATRYNIDPDRVYANGFSNGGGMAFVLSCRLPERIAAVGMVGAAQTLPWSWCSEQRPVPLINFHGTGDTAAPYEGGHSWVLPRAAPPLPPVERWTRMWAKRNRCWPEPVRSRPAPDVTRLQFSDCEGNADVVLYTIAGGGHTWPGGTPLPEWFVGTTSNAVDATEEMWRFFREHPLRGRQAAASSQ